MASAAQGRPATARDVVLDANVLYQNLLRALLLWIAAAGGFRPRWTEHILEEVRRNLVDVDQVITSEQWEHLEANLTAAFPAALVDTELVDATAPAMPNDAKDRHVVAAAVVSGASAVITGNLKHFKPADVAQVGQRAISPDEFLCELLTASPQVVGKALHQLAASTRTPRRWTVEEVLGALTGLGRGDPIAPCFVKLAQQAFQLTPAPPP